MFLRNPIKYLQYSTSNPFSIHRLLPGPGSPMHPSLSKAELHYNDYALQNHTLHHDSMYYNPPVYQVCSFYLTEWVHSQVSRYLCQVQILLDHFLPHISAPFLKPERNLTNLMKLSCAARF